MTKDIRQLGCAILNMITTTIFHVTGSNFLLQGIQGDSKILFYYYARAFSAICSKFRQINRL